jgi:hypothetical protein
MTRNRFGILVIVTVLLGFTALAGPTAADPGTAKMRPLNISLEFTGTPGDFACPDGLVPQEFEGSGHLSHLGRVEISGGACNDFVNLEIVGGFGTYVAANGDSIDVEFSGTASFIPPATLLGEGSGAIVGGTGRFESVTGAFDFTSETIGEQTSLVGQGWIAYDASDRSRN